MPDLRYRIENGIRGHNVVGYSEQQPKQGHKGTTYKKQAIKAARDLGYGYDILAKLENAKTDAELDHIMSNERKRRL